MTTTREQSASPTQGSALPIVDVLLTITRFVEILRPIEGCAVSEHALELLDNHPDVTLRNDLCQELVVCQRSSALRIANRGAVVRVMLRAKGRRLRPMSMTIFRHQGERRIPVFASNGVQTGTYSCFSGVQFNGPTVQFTDTRLPKGALSKEGSECFSGVILVVDVDTGEVTIVFLPINHDYVENNND